MTDEDEPKTLEEAAREELVELWDDLDKAIRSALNTTWSIQCDNIAYRIVTLSRFVGATSWEQVQVNLLRDGTYERVYTEAGISYEQPDWDRVAEVEAYIQQSANKR